MSLWAQGHTGRGPGFPKADQSHPVRLSPGRMQLGAARLHWGFASQLHSFLIIVKGGLGLVGWESDFPREGGPPTAPGECRLTRLQTH